MFIIIILIFFIVEIFIYFNFTLITLIYGAEKSSVGIATRYELDGPGIESRWGRGFPHPSILALGPNQPPIQWVLGLFPRDKAVGTRC
jgi:hypothetical protein